MSFHTKLDDQFNNLFSMRAGDLETRLPAVAHLLVRNAYFSLNGFYTAGQNNRELGLPYPLRGVVYLRYLNTCFADLVAPRSSAARHPTCQLCGQHIHDPDDAEIDHIKHYWRGGETIPPNARLAHRYCNRARGGRD